MLSAGMALRWLRNTLLGEAASYSEMDRQAERLKPGCEGRFSPLFGGERSRLWIPEPGAALSD